MRMYAGWLLVLLAGSASAVFGPNVRVDHENRASHGCFHVMLTTGPSDSGPQPVYAVFENDSIPGMLIVRQDIYFQKSTDAGRTWLAEDVLIRRGANMACYPDITTDPSGNIYIIYTERVSGSNGHIWSTSSRDSGATWSARTRVDDNAANVQLGWARICADSAGNLFAAWNDHGGSYLRIWSSVSTDGGASWQPNVRVDDDTVSFDAFSPDAFIQPGTNDYLVAFPGPVRVQPQGIVLHTLVARSLDQSRTFESSVILDTFRAYCQQPHLVADRDWVICDFTGNSSSNRGHTQCQSSSDGGATWSAPVEMTELGGDYNSYANGANLAIDRQGTVHTGLLICDTVSWNYEIYYAFSADHGFTWSEREMVNDVLTEQQQDPDITADDEGSVYLAWQDRRNARNEIWFATNHPSAAVAEERSLSRLDCRPSHFRDRVTIVVPPGSASSAVSIYDATGRLVRTLPSTGTSVEWNGCDPTGRRCPPGVYLISARPELRGFTRVVLVR